jgi:hypothetical protein
MALDGLMREAHDRKPDALTGRFSGNMFNFFGAITATAACMAASGPHGGAVILCNLPQERYRDDA